MTNRPLDIRNSPDDDHRYIAHVIDHFSNFNVFWGLKMSVCSYIKYGSKVLYFKSFD
jgi:hypothetical protein